MITGELGCLVTGSAASALAFFLLILPIVQILIPLPEFYRYNEEQKMTELGRSSISDDFSNFSWSSVFPMTFAAAAI